MVAVLGGQKNGRWIAGPWFESRAFWGRGAGGGVAPFFLCDFSSTTVSCSDSCFHALGLFDTDGRKAIDGARYRGRATDHTGKGRRECRKIRGKQEAIGSLILNVSLMSGGLGL